MIESKLLSKVIDEQSFLEIQKHNITVHDFENYGDVFLFIQKYVKEYGQTPDRRTVVEEFEDFEYVPEVYDAFSFLCDDLKDRTAKRRAFEMLQGQAKENFQKMKGRKFTKWLREEAERIEATTNTDFSSGSNFATNGDERRAWYEESKDPTNRMFIPTPYKKLTSALGGGFEIGDYVLLLAFTNKGKSWIASDCGLASWRGEFGVLHYSPELSKRQQMFRLDTLEGKFDNVKLRRGQLDNEGKFLEYTKKFTGQYETPYIVKTMEDLPDGLTVEAIERDLQMFPNVKMVIIDGFNLMIHKSGDGNRNKMTNTSRRLRQIFGKYGVTGIVVHQASAQSEKDKKKGLDDESDRLVNPPEITDFSETSAVIQDASTILTFDALEGIGSLAIRKAREPSVGTIVDLVTQFNEGIIKEPSDVDYF